MHLLRKITWVATLFLLVGTVFSQSKSKKHIPDGMYLVIKIDTLKGHKISTLENEKVVRFNKLFDEFNEDEFTQIVIDISDFVPLELQKAPESVPQTEHKKLLLLTLSEEASEKLKTFSAKNVMKHVVLVVDGEALTMHKIKEPITSGLLQITRCNDNACEKLFVTLKDNLK